MEATKSLVKWVAPTDLYENDGNYVSRIPVIPLADLTELVEGLRKINTLAVHNHTDAFDPMRWLIEIAEESQHLLTQLEAHRKEGA